MNNLARVLIAVPALLLSAGAAAQTVKCVNAAGKVTYTSGTCANLGLKDAGEVRDQLNVSPAGRVVPFTAPPAPAAAAPPAGATGGAGANAKPAAEAERRCFKTAKGSRCNDDPAESNAVPNDARTAGENKAQ